MKTKELEQINSTCSICHADITIIKGRSNLCTNCKTNIAYIARNHHNPERKLFNLRLRAIALTEIKSNPKLGVTEALRMAVNASNATTINQG